MERQRKGQWKGQGRAVRRQWTTCRAAIPASLICPPPAAKTPKPHINTSASSKHPLPIRLSHSAHLAAGWSSPLYLRRRRPAPLPPPPPLAAQAPPRGARPTPSRRRECHFAAPPLPSAGVSIGMEREGQQNDSIADGGPHPYDSVLPAGGQVPAVPAELHHPHLVCSARAEVIRPNLPEDSPCLMRGL